MVGRGGVCWARGGWVSLRRVWSVVFGAVRGREFARGMVGVEWRMAEKAYLWRMKFCMMMFGRWMRGAMMGLMMGASASACAAYAADATGRVPTAPPAAIRLAVSRTELYYPLLAGKKVGVVANHASVHENRTHLVDSLLADGVKVVRLFSPEHGLRGEAEAGAHVQSGTDAQTGLPVVSLYGNHKKPTREDLSGLEVILFDLQDVGVRFYTYISTLHYVMEACAEAGLPLVVLDRPNPHIGAIDGPVLDTTYKSFVGMHPVPLLYGLTIGEYAKMIQGEGWVPNGAACPLTVIPLAHYTRRTPYDLPLPPSPNLTSMTAIAAYPSLCLFEGTPVSVGRGTDTPFECYGFAGCKQGTQNFTPRSLPGKAADPPYKDKECRGFKVGLAPGWLSADGLIRDERPSASDTLFHPLYLNLQPVITMYRAYPDKAGFFTKFFRKLAGNTELERQVAAGMREEEIRATWQEALDAYRHRAERYYLYE